MSILDVSALSKEEESRLILKSRSDPQAFAPVYEQYYDRVYLYLLRRCENSTTAEDLTSETFIKAMRSIRRYGRQQAPFLAWLFRIAHNTFISHWRKEKVRRLFRIEWNRGKAVAEGAAVNPFHESEMAQAGETVARLIRGLKPCDQLIITLRYYEDMNLRDLAFAARMSEGNVRTRLHRALVRLKSLIESEAPDLAALIKGDE